MTTYAPQQPATELRAKLSAEIDRLGLLRCSTSEEIESVQRVLTMDETELAATRDETIGERTGIWRLLK